MHSVRRADQRSATPEGPPGGQSARAKYVWTELAIAVVAQDVGRVRCHAFNLTVSQDDMLYLMLTTWTPRDAASDCAGDDETDRSD